MLERRELAAIGISQFALHMRFRRGRTFEGLVTDLLTPLEQPNCGAI